MPRSKTSSPRRSSRWSLAEARGVVDELSRSGLPASRFAAQRGLGVKRLYAWRKRLRRQAKPPVPTSGFTEVRLTTAPTTIPIEVLLPNGMAVRLAGPSRVDDVLAMLTRLLPR